MSLVHRLAFGVKHMLELDIAAHNLVTYPDDTFIVSYPQSGTDWSTPLIANLLQPERSLKPRDLERLIPAVNGHTRGFFKAMPRPRVIADQGTFNPQYTNVIYIVRDPRDVVVSTYNVACGSTRTGRPFPILDFVNGFVRESRSTVGTWGDNVTSWLATRGNTPRFLLLRYEDLFFETVRELGKVARFLGIHVSSHRLADAVNWSSSGDPKTAQEKHKRKNGPRVSPAAPGLWRSKLPEAAVTEIELAWAPLMAKLGYNLSIPQVVESGAVDAAF